MGQIGLNLVQWNALLLPLLNLGETVLPRLSRLGGTMTGVLLPAGLEVREEVGDVAVGSEQLGDRFAVQPEGGASASLSYRELRIENLFKSVLTFAPAFVGVEPEGEEGDRVLDRVGA
jgi:hypothetical protein